MKNYIFLLFVGAFFSSLIHAAELEVYWVYEPEDIAYNPDLSWAGGYVDPVVSSPILDGLGVWGIINIFLKRK